MNGIITINSKVSQGTSFRITMPLKISHKMNLLDLNYENNNSQNNEKISLLFSPINSPYKKNACPINLTYILITYYNVKEKSLIESIFQKLSAQCKFQERSKIIDYDTALKLLEEKTDQFNSIIILSLNQFVFSLSFLAKVKYYQQQNLFSHIPTLVVGREEVREHLKDFRNLGINNFVFESTEENLEKSIFREFKIMIKREMFYN